MDTNPPLISRRTIIWLAVFSLLGSTVLVIFAGVRSSASNSAELALSSFVAPAVTSSDWTLGNKDARVTLIEYGDYQCPACGAYHPLLKKLMDEYGDRVLFVFREFPLTSIHENAMPAAEAAETAGLQGKYWEMHNLLYEKQLEWSLLPFELGLRQYLNSHATSIGLDVKQFNDDITSNKVTDKIAADIAGAKAIQVEHTPTFFINLKRIQNPQNYEEFKADIEQALRAQ